MSGWLALCHAAQVHADGAMVVGEHVLFRQGPVRRGYCDVPSAECPKVMTKVLSSYGFLRGSLRGAATLEPGATTHVSGLGALHLDGASAGLPGGEMTAVTLDGVLSAERMSRLRFTLMDLQNVFACHDLQHDSTVFPFIGMASRQCSGDAIFGIDARALRFQWDAHDQSLLAEWFHAGPAFELLANGLSQAHLLRSVTLAPALDAQTRYAHRASTDLGAGARLSALYRTPFWESRLRVTYRSVLAGGAGLGHDHRLEGEVRVVRNWFMSDGLVMQTGLFAAQAWATRPALADALLASRTSNVSLAAGVYIGWVSEAPGI